jgi:hypothetical protein
MRETACGCHTCSSAVRGSTSSGKEELGHGRMKKDEQGVSAG